MELDFSGAYTALVTPFDEANSIDEKGLVKNIKFQLDRGIDGLVPVGTTGESPTLTPEEHELLIEITVKHAKGKARVIAGTGSNNTQEAVHYTKFAEEAGADAALVITPYYNKPTQEGLYQHYKKLSEEVDIPIIIYNVPSRTGRNIDAATVLKLAEFDNIVGVKEASCNMDQIMEIIRKAPEGFTMLSGEDSWTYAMLCLGAHGVISVASNVAPDAVAEMTHKYLEGNVDASRNIHYKYLDLFGVIFIETNPSPIKEAMNMMGLAAGKPRLPLVQINEKSKIQLEKVLLDLGLL
ncbi:MAG: 4-hydroxy-tetrahydrodipicolinate synthase [Candidatus Altiarchaeota archaeon]|nr:4-hydroxy-tetrahydrodipicolinate synthase [Candidatus Altiarchaeota archaeon]